MEDLELSDLDCSLLEMVGDKLGVFRNVGLEGLKSGLYLCYLLPWNEG